MKKKFLTALCIASLPFLGFTQEEQAKTNRFWDNWYVGINTNALTHVMGDFSDGYNPVRHLGDYTGAFGVGFTVGKNFCDNTWGLYGEYFYNSNLKLAKVNGNFTNRTLDARMMRINLGIHWNVSRTFNKNENRIVDFALQAGIGANNVTATHTIAYIPSEKGAVRNPFTGSINLGFELIGHVAKAVDLRWRSDFIGGPSDMDIPNDNLPFKIYWNNSVGVSYNFSAPRNKYTIDDVYEKVNNLDKKMDDLLDSKNDGLKNELQGVRDEIREGNGNVIKKIDEMSGKIANMKTASSPANVQNLQPVFFGFNKTSVDNDQKYAVEALANALKANSGAKVTITGYADPTGPAEVNQRISERRAEACKKMLVDQFGIGEDRVTIKGAGSVSNFSKSTNVLNRRAEFTIQ